MAPTLDRSRRMSSLNPSSSKRIAASTGPAAEREGFLLSTAGPRMSRLAMDDRRSCRAIFAASSRSSIVSVPMTTRSMPRSRHSRAAARSPVPASRTKSRSVLRASSAINRRLSPVPSMASRSATYRSMRPRSFSRLSQIDSGRSPVPRTPRTGAYSFLWPLTAWTICPFIRSATGMTFTGVHPTV